MPTYKKHELINTLEDRIEGHLQIAINDFQNMDPEILLKPSITGGWSIAQCLDHLNSYGNYYLPLIKKGIDQQQGRSDNNEFRSTWLGNYFTKMMEPGNDSKKYKAFKGHIPQSNLNAHKVVAEFIEQQESLLKLVKQSQNVDLNRIKIPISIMKWLKLRLGDVFSFIVAHDERHIQQAKRNYLSVGVFTRVS